MDDLSRYYRTLGLEVNSSPEQVKQAYRDLVRVWHPDRFSHDERLRLIAQEKLREINGAYEVLKAAFFECADSVKTGRPEDEVPCSSPGDAAGKPVQSGAKGNGMWVGGGIVALAALGIASLILARGYRARFGLPSQTGQLQIAASNAATSGPASVASNSHVAKTIPAEASTIAPAHGSLSMDGTSHVRIAASGRSLTGTFTIECWALTRDVLRRQHLLSSRAPRENGFDLKFDQGKMLHADIGNGAAWITTEAEAPLKLSRDTWYHIACVVIPNHYAIYLNGTLTASKDFPSSTPVLYDADHQLIIGDCGAECLDGLMAELRIWESPRSQAQIRANMNRRLNGNEPGLRAYWPLDEGVGTMVTDRTGQGLTGTLVENSTWSTNAPPLLVP